MIDETEIEIIGPIAKDLSEVSVPFFDTEVSAGYGFEPPSIDYAEHPIDLNKELIRDKDSTFVVRVRGDSMIDFHVVPGSILIVDRSVTPIKEKDDNKRYMVLAVVENKFTVKNYWPRDGRIWLVPGNKKYKPVLIDESHNFYIWGVVTKIVIDTMIKEHSTPSWTEITSIAPVKGYSSQDWVINP